MDEARQVEIGRLKTRLSELVTTFSSNLNEENTVLLFSEDELEGVPKPLLDSFEKVSLPPTVDAKGLKKYKLSTRYFSQYS